MRKKREKRIKKSEKDEEKKRGEIWLVGKFIEKKKEEWSNLGKDRMNGRLSKIGYGYSFNSIKK